MRGLLVEDENLTTRRRFYLSALYGLGALIGAALAVPSLLYLLIPPAARSKRSSWVDAGSLKQLTPGTPQQLTFRQTSSDGWKVTSVMNSAWVVKVSDKEVWAYSPWCTHLGCAYHWDSRKDVFACPCHGSAFALDGKVLAGPAPRPLDRYAVKIEGDQLWLGALQKNGGA